MAQMTLQQALELALRHHQAGRLTEAEQVYRQILAQQPANSDALHLLGMIAYQSGRLDVAEDLIRRAIAENPRFAAAYSNLGNLLRDQGRFDESITACRQAIVLGTDYADAHNNLGNALKDTGQLDEAIAAYRRAVDLRTDYAEAHSNLGAALKDKGQLDEAIAACRRAVALRPNFPEAHNNLGIVLSEMGRLDEAVAAYNQAILQNPDYAQAYNNLGSALKDAGELDAAIAVVRQAIALRPGDAEAQSHLGSALKDAGQLDEAIAAYRQAVRLDPGNAAVGSNLIYTLQFHPGYDGRAIAEECRRWNDAHALPLERSAQPPRNDPNPLRRLKIGYVSPDFRNHAEAFFVAPLLREHDHENFEIHCYASVVRPDQTTALLKGYADAWHDVTGNSDEQVADRIRQDQIDVLVDLTMHMANNRLLTFARKPAPVQVTWLAYPGGTGLTAIDYRLTDAFMDPPGTSDAMYAEKSVRLPDCWCCYDPLCEPLPIGQPPVATSGHITFGALNNFCKMNEEVLELWGRVFATVPDSRLLLLAQEGEHRQRVLDFLQKHGVTPQRVEFVHSQPRDSYLQLYSGIDLALDPFPYNGITTTCDALWMGVPVVTWAQERAASRAGLSLLSTIGLSELVATSADQFVAIAADLAGDVAKLNELRSTLRPRMERSPLMDAPRFARNIEAAYRRMWQTWCEKASTPS